MTFPFTTLTAAARQEGLIVAVLIGIAFGFVLERAGFGRADKLAAQFYLRDMRVFKVMFTAIVTAMLGLVIASGLGLTSLRDISESIASLTWIWPMAIGGFVLGAGFIISGYCPGTSIVAMGSGNVDGLFTVIGVISGTFVYSELLQIPKFHQFHNAAPKGAWFLYDVVKVAPALIALAVTLMAVLAFIGAEKVEAMLGGSKTALMTRRIVFASLLAVALVAAAPRVRERSESRGGAARAETITASQLAKIVVDEPWSVRVIDVRDAAAFAKERIPGAINLPASSLAELTADSRRIVVVAEGSERLPAVESAAPLVLAGGMAAWNADPLVKALTTGAPPPPPAAAAGGVIARPKKKGGGCSA